MSLDDVQADVPTEADVLASFPALPDVMDPPDLVQQASVFRIYPDDTQIAAFRQWIGAARWLWNRYVEINQHLYDYEGRFAFQQELSSLLPQMKKAQGLEWLAEPPASHIVDVSCRFDQSLRKFLDDKQAVRAGRMSKNAAAGFPRFKSKRDREGSVYVSGQNVRLIRREANPHAARGWVELPAMDQTEVWERTVKGGKRKGQVDELPKPLRKAIRIRGGRWPEGHVQSVTIREDAPGVWIMSVQYLGPPPKRKRRGEDIDVPDPEVAARGYDLGCSSAAVGSDGSRLEPDRPLRKRVKRLRRAQRRSARRRQARLDQAQEKKKDIPRSRRERRAYAEEARIHHQVRNARYNFTHQFTHRATAKAVVTCAEDLNVSGMIRNPKLALSVSDAGMGEILRQLEYKSEWRGRHFVKIDRWAPSSKTCSGCDHKLDELSLSTRRWVCPACGADHDRDENAALNILRWGLKEALRRGTPKVTPGESRALVGGKSRKGKRTRRNSARKAQ
ncbi:RNA-guided endonuclease InsQ/TnpB family protein [Salipiger mucosus]|nr:RNA-guided endonuclease TnpB family protein [Salipiger mucosus]